MHQIVACRTGHSSTETVHLLKFHLRIQGDYGFKRRSFRELLSSVIKALLTVGSRHYFIGCTLATTKQTKEDWSNPGKIYVGEYTGVGPLQVKVLKDGLTKNHGYSRLDRGGALSGLVTCEQGAFEVVPPQAPDGEWTVTQFMDWPISDISAIDIDGDGELEFATIEAFHGEYFRIYKKIDGAFKKIYEHPETTEFYHVVVGTTLAGKPVFLGGCRRGPGPRPLHRPGGRPVPARQPPPAARDTGSD